MSLPQGERVEVLSLLEQYESLSKIEECQEFFIPFVKAVWPEFVEGRHHKIMGKAFEAIANGTLKRLIINMPPRHTKSEFASYLLPAWILGIRPDFKIIQATHTAELSVGFGRKVRNLVNSEDYANIFPGTQLSADSKASGRWNTNKRGEYYATGVGGSIAGRGANLFIVDDPHSEQDVLLKDPSKLFSEAYNWYTSGPRQRMQPDGAIVIVMTRWDERDLTGMILKEAAKAGSLHEWKVIEFPMQLPSGRPLWPEYWSAEEMEKLKRDLPSSKWLGQYQQQPTSEEGALVKREWWNVWPDGKPAPECSFIIQAWDTAYLKTQTSDYNACTTWGVFRHPDKKGVETNQIILLDAINERMEFPELKEAAYKHYKDRKPDCFLIEARAAGVPLLYELRRMGILVTEFTVGRGSKRMPNDKHSRINAISDMFKSGIVWRPDAKWAEEVADQFAAFPNGEHDDLVDSSVMALTRFRQGGFVSLYSDEPDKPYIRPRKADYY